jgi:hypothetical protein
MQNSLLGDAKREKGQQRSSSSRVTHNMSISRMYSVPALVLLRWCGLPNVKHGVPLGAGGPHGASGVVSWDEVEMKSTLETVASKNPPAPGTATSDGQSPAISCFPVRMSLVFIRSGRRDNPQGQSFRGVPSLSP